MLVEPNAAHLEVRGVGKRFGAFRALDDVSLDVRRGTVHALVGENGAGKSTLGRIISGHVAPSDGGVALRVPGQPPLITADQLRSRVALVDQELALVPTRSVQENVLLGVLPARAWVVDRRAMRRRMAELFDRTGFALDPDASVGSLRVADRQLVTILRAFATGADLVVMDEPTAALTRTESRSLLAVIDRMRAEGTTFVYVSHFLPEVLSIADDVTVLKDGRRTWSGPAAEQTPQTLVESMLGRSLTTMFPPRAGSAQPGTALDVTGLTSGRVVQDVSFSIAPGEIVGIAGIVGSGRSELAHAILGARSVSAGRLRLQGADYVPRTPSRAWRRGIRMLPESRRDQGLSMRHSVTWNVVLPHLSRYARGTYLAHDAGAGEVRELLDRMDYRGNGTAIAVGALSGGNQQKALLARCLLGDPAVLIVDEPTRGVDVGARNAIYSMINTAADRGVAVLVISSELEEVLGLADRVLAMRQGRIVAELDRGCSESAVLNAILGNAAEPRSA